MAEDDEGSGTGDVSLSVSETNALRAKLGLKPLKETVDKKKVEYDRWKKEKDQADSDKQALAVMNKIFESKEKREINNKYKKIKSLGAANENDDVDDVLSWVKKSRTNEKLEKEKAKAKALSFDEMDADADAQSTETEQYSMKNLDGLKVLHDMADIAEGSTILTLKDSNIRDMEDDQLENVDIVATEKAREFIENRKNKPNYNAYGDDEFDEDGNPILGKKSILSHFDETIEGKKQASFLLTDQGAAEDQEKREKEEMAEKLRLMKQDLKVKIVPRASTYTQEEMVSFKKPKRRRKTKSSKKGLSASDLQPIDDADGDDHGSRARGRRRRGGSDDDDDDDNNKDEASKGGLKNKMKINIRVREKDSSDEEEEESEILDAMEVDETEVSAMQDVIDDSADLEVMLALTRARKLKEKKSTTQEENQAKLQRNLAQRRAQDKQKEDEEDANVLILDQSSANNKMFSANEEMIKNLGSVEDGSSHAAKLALKLSKKATEEKEEEDESLKDSESTEFSITETTLVNSSLAAAMSVAKTKGLLIEGTGGHSTLIVDSALKRDQDEADSRTEREKDRDKYRHRSREKGLVDREKEREREREAANRRGSSFEELRDYKPDVDLKFIDDDGNAMNQKQAFKHLSHRFHGNGPGKNKIEKMMKREAMTRKQMSVKAGDTTMEKLKKKTKAESKAFVVLGKAGISANALEVKNKQSLSKKRKAKSSSKSSKQAKVDED